jgi:putative transposase
MKWLQSTFAHRYNRLRRENGHVFQGRYKALLIEDQARLGALCHYIHLNPVRARMLPVERLGEYFPNSYWMLQNPKKRPSWLNVQTGLEVAGEWSDTTLGRREYDQYLHWLAEDEPAQKELRFEDMRKGWVVGSLAFKKALVEDHKNFSRQRRRRMRQRRLAN